MLFSRNMGWIWSTFNQSDGIRWRLFNSQDGSKEPQMYFVHYFSPLLSGAPYGAGSHISLLVWRGYLIDISIIWDSQF